VTPELLEAIDNNQTSNPLTVTTRDFKEVDEEEVEVTVTEQLTPEELYPRHSAEDAHMLVQRQAGKGRSAEDLLRQAIRLKQPALTTQKGWERYLSDALTIANRSFIDEFNEDDARKYRDHLIDTLNGTTVKNRIRSVKGLFNVAKDEGWIETNPFDCVNLKYIKASPKAKEVRRLDEVDKSVCKLVEYQQCLYWLMRYTGTHVSEAAGLRFEDIDLAGGVIHIRANELRPLKNNYRTRDLPIIKPLQQKPKELLPKQDTGHIFPGLYDEKYSRRGNGMHWQHFIDISPKACRDAVATASRDADVNERVLGAILGHTPKSSTGVYGSVSMEAKQKALEALIK
jgi:integrase